MVPDTDAALLLFGLDFFLFLFATWLMIPVKFLLVVCSASLSLFSATYLRATWRSTAVCGVREEERHENERRRCNERKTAFGNHSSSNRSGRRAGGGESLALSCLELRPTDTAVTRGERDRRRSKGEKGM